VDFTPLQLVLGSAELLIMAAGAFLLARTFGRTGARTAFCAKEGLPPWALSGLEAVLLAAIVFLFSASGQTFVLRVIAPHLHLSANQEGMQVILLGIGFHGIGLLGWPAFYLYKRWLSPSTLPVAATAVPASPKLSWPQVVRYGVLTLVMGLPLISLLSFLWINVLHQFGLSEDQQDAITIFANTKSPVVLAGMLVIACIIAPLYEELLFRGTIYRGLRGRFGRVVAIVASGTFFGVLHFNWAGSIPLAAFGMILAIAYEYTGDLRVSIVAHALFNLNTIAVVLSGLQQ